MRAESIARDYRTVWPHSPLQLYTKLFSSQLTKACSLKPPAIDSDWSVLEVIAEREVIKRSDPNL